ncbi:RGS domain-containing protein [Plasmodiophora brassicae]|nr:hypothetical protein PBRA_007492 [Plasmodiophora brassicae]
MLLWVPVTVCHVMAYTTGLVLFWRRRHLQPIRNIRPWLLFTCNCCLCLHSLSMCAVASLAGRQRMMALAPTLIMFAFQNAVFDSFTMFAASLYFAYQRTHAQVCLADDISTTVHDSEKFHRRLARIRRLSWLLSPLGIGSLMAMSCLVMLCCAIVYVFAACPDLLTTPFLDAYLSMTGFTRLSLVYFGKFMVQSVSMAVLSVRLRLIVDKFGVKSILVAIAIPSSLGMLAYIAFLNRLLNTFQPHMLLSMLFVVVAVDYVLFRCLAVPIYQTYLPHSNEVLLPANQVSLAGTLERFLQSSDRRYSAFRKQLEDEICVENLLFWRDAEAYRQRYPSPDSPDKAFLIWKTYICRGSPLEINISASIRQAFDVVGTLAKAAIRNQSRRAVAPISAVHAWPAHLLRGDVFRPACTQVLMLMCDNSLGRFQRDNPDIWDEFMNESNECRFSHIDLFGASKHTSKKPSSQTIN